MSTESQLIKNIMESTPAGTDHRQAAYKNVKKMSIRLALANIEKMDDASLLELHIALEELKIKHKFVPQLVLLSETWENKDAQKHYELPNYTYIGKPITRNPGSTRDHGGTGVWIPPHMVYRV